MGDDYDYTCHSVGINGGCGLDCPVLLRGDCDEEDTMYCDKPEPTPKEFTDFDRAMEIFK